MSIDRRQFLLSGLLAPLSTTRAETKGDYPIGYRRIVSAAFREGRLVVYSTTDISAASPLLADFRTLYPGIEVNYAKLNSPELYQRFVSETESQGYSADVTWSSSMDLQIKLANDGYAEPYRSPESRHLPEWAVWRYEAYGTTFEPLAIAYNRRLVTGKNVPRDHNDLRRILTERRDLFRGNVVTYDIEKSAVGFLGATQDSLTMSSYWSLVSALGACDVQMESNTSPMLEHIATGMRMLAYNILGSYAIAKAMHDPAIGVCLPADYTLVLSRVILIARRAKNPNAAKLWLDYLLSRRGQQLAGQQSRLFSIRTDVQGETTATGLSAILGKSIHPISIGPGLLVYLDGAKRAAFARRWREAVQPGLS